MVQRVNGTDQKFVVLANHHAEVDFLQEMLSPKYNTAWEQAGVPSIDSRAVQVIR